ncbi:hypothetical protein EIN_185190 [Entamoeba invadens IP1]|uniref:hypothetical protein n=1 Tax=Entamoeba invadens IP1 TaxID=370355 RepID=UPI0002C3D948|nr:hypothetical protein EIN_185190 [Entamoeba invadens IP1]ELP94142.1 hypothetical protein EIN_185190 [Entamoeba invadens IP1]|eukprot:XP_004260913.1 hypothetical protein EIN_185190 [Entamoeba invadens IP1]
MTMDPVKAKKVFETYATDKFLDKSKFKEALGALFEVDYKDENIDEAFEDLFKMADGKGIFNKKDSKINYSEFNNLCKLLPAKWECPKQVILTLLFRLADTNNSGKLNKKEFASYIKKTSIDMNNDDMLVVYERLDSNGDGKITYDEFIQLYGLSDN